VSVYDLGDVATFTFKVTDTTGAPANATTVVATITLPDATSATPTVSNPVTGTYTATYTPSQIGRHGVRFVATGTNATAQTDVFDVRDSALLPLIGLGETKDHLNIPAATTTYDDELRRHIDTATELVETHCGRYFRRQTVVVYPHPDTTILLNPPVVSITSVVIDGTTISASNYHVNRTTGVLTLDTHPGYDVDDVTITYVAGTNTPPEPVRHATMLLTAHLWETQRGRVARPRATDDGYAPGTTFTMPRRVEEILAMYRLGGFA